MGLEDWIGKQEIWILFPVASTSEHFFSSLSALVISCGNKTCLLSLSTNEGQMPYIVPSITKTPLSSEEQI